MWGRGLESGPGSRSLAAVAGSTGFAAPAAGSNSTTAAVAAVADSTGFAAPAAGSSSKTAVVAAVGSKRAAAVAVGSMWSVG